MDNTVLNIIKGIFAALTAAIANEYGVLMPVLGVFCGAMVIDFVTGLSASASEGKDNPDAGLSSKRGLQGILKKVGYLAVIAVAMMVDWLIYHTIADLGITVPGIAGANTFFGLLVAVWFIINECISILENVARMSGEKNLPVFLVTVLNLLKRNVEKTGEQGTDKMNESKDNGGKE